MRNIFYVLAITACGSAPVTPTPASDEGRADALAVCEGPPMTEPDTIDIEPIVAELVKAHGAAEEARIRRGLEQVVPLWRPGDGDLAAFARDHYIADPALREATFARFEAMMELIGGHFLELKRDLDRPTQLAIGPNLPVDELVATWSPGAHVSEDLFLSKVGFIPLLNFPVPTLAERSERAASMSREAWAIDRLTERFATRIPANVLQRITDVGAKADLYIADYNL
jgi:hypothetical protein